jgi:hypothetical protein
MRIGDATAEVWMDTGAGDEAPSYCVEITSSRKVGPVVYGLRVERWEGNADEARCAAVVCRAVLSTFDEAMSRGRAEARLDARTQARAS